FPPSQAVEENKLRLDLFYRLGVVNISIPPLRKRKGDIPLFVKFFILKFNKKLLRNVERADREVFDFFNSYNWPGNVRELQHVIEHALNIMAKDDSIITMEYLPEHILSSYNEAEEIPPIHIDKNNTKLQDTIDNMECHIICKALRDNLGNISKTARTLGMSRQNLQYRIKRYDISIKNLLRQRE